MGIIISLRNSWNLTASSLNVNFVMSKSIQNIFSPGMHNTLISGLPLIPAQSKQMSRSILY